MIRNPVLRNPALKNPALRNPALRLAGATAIAAAGYHAVVGDSTIRAIEMAEDDMAFVSSTFQLGTMGWVAGGVLLLGAAGIADQQARNWIVGVTAALYGLPALGTLTLTGGKPSLGGALLGAATALALYGRRSGALADKAGGMSVPRSRALADA